MAEKTEVIQAFDLDPFGVIEEEDGVKRNRAIDILSSIAYKHKVKMVVYNGDIITATVKGIKTTAPANDKKSVLMVLLIEPDGVSYDGISYPTCCVLVK